MHTFENMLARNDHFISTSQIDTCPLGKNDEPSEVSEAEIQLAMQACSSSDSELVALAKTSNGNLVMEFFSQTR
jgi:hypothetical protein